MAKISLEEAQARAWIDKVIQETKQVRTVLQDVEKSSSTTPAETDSIMQKFDEWGKGVNKMGKKMCDTYDRTATDLKEKLADFFKAAEAKREEIVKNQGKIKAE